MTPVSINTLNKTNKSLLNTGATERASNNTAAADYLKNNSIFTIAAKKKPDNKPSESDKDLLAKGNNSKSEANESSTGAKGWIEKCKGLKSDMMSSTVNSNKTANIFQQKSEKTAQLFESYAAKAASINSDNESIANELSSLTSERESLMVGNETGVGKKSAFSLSIPSDGDNGKPMKGLGGLLGGSITPQVDNDNESKLKSVDSKIENLTGKSASNNGVLFDTIKSSNNTYKAFQSSTRMASVQANAQRKAADAAAKQAATANAVGTVTTVLGVATSAVGLAMAAGIFTAPASPPVTVAGATGSATGAAATTAASVTSATATGAINGATKLATLLPKIEKAIGLAQSAVGLFTTVKNAVKS